MEHRTLNLNQYLSKIELTRFAAADVEETHAILHVDANGELFEGQLRRLQLSLQTLIQDPEMEGHKIVFMRYFLSDVTNQAPLIKKTSGCTVSFIQQPPLDGSKVALWIYMQRGTNISTLNGSTVVTHNGYRHIWSMGLTNTSVDTSYMQTWTTMLSYIDTLKLFGATLRDNCLRTWFYVRDVDTQYSGLVKSRCECFQEQGLTADTHYIASTGIGGIPADPKAIIQMDCYALTGFEAQQQRYLYAPTHLNKTIEYGVTFERATLMQYGDRNHIYISGTASINNKGEVVHVGDIQRQTLRMWENVEKLLEEGGMDISDIMQIIVYLRDSADYKLIQRMFAEKFPNKPCVITLAPVCRPTWLIEMECIAVKASQNEYRNF